MKFIFRTVKANINRNDKSPCRFCSSTAQQLFITILGILIGLVRWKKTHESSADDSRLLRSNKLWFVKESSRYYLVNSQKYEAKINCIQFLICIETYQSRAVTLGACAEISWRGISKGFGTDGKLQLQLKKMTILRPLWQTVEFCVVIRDVEAEAGSESSKLTASASTQLRDSQPRGHFSSWRNFIVRILL